MTRKKFIKYLEGLEAKAMIRFRELMLTEDNESLNFQLGKVAAYRTVIYTLREQEESEASE